MRRPFALLYWPMALVLRWFGFFKGQRIIQKTRLQRPAIILSNHTSFFDFIYTIAAAFPHRINFLVAQKFFYDPALGWLMRAARAIPKSLFQPDPRAIRHTLKILQQKGIIGIFPEGQISSYGETLPISEAIAKLVKKAGVHVYVIKHHNAYWVNPPWSQLTFAGRIETTVKEILTPETLKTATEAEIHRLITTELAYNASLYNQQKQYHYRVQSIHNLENLIYQCPVCHKKGLVAEDTKLKCQSCMNVFPYNSNGMIGSYLLSELYYRQKETLEATLANQPNFRLEATVTLESFHDNRVQVVGQGRLVLTPLAYEFDGTFLGLPLQRSFPTKSVPTLPSDIGKNIQIYDQYQLYQFVFQDPQLPIQFVIAGEYFYRQQHLH